VEVDVLVQNRIAAKEWIEKVKKVLKENIEKAKLLAKELLDTVQKLHK